MKSHLQASNPSLKQWTIYLQIKWNITYGFQCSLEILYKLPNIIGRILSMFSSIRLRIYSLFQKYKALSATWNTKLGVHSNHKISYHKVCLGFFLGLILFTWKCELDTLLDICLNKGSSIFLNCVGSITSKISSISPKNMTCLFREKKRMRMFYITIVNRSKQNTAYTLVMNVQRTLCVVTRHLDIHRSCAA